MLPLGKRQIFTRERDRCMGNKQNGKSDSGKKLCLLYVAFLLGFAVPLWGFFSYRYDSSRLLDLNIYVFP